jgi:predicted nicotinamide N-methyase
MSFQYELKRVHEQVGPIRVEIECLADLNRTIDDLFAQLERDGNPQLLEELCPYFGTIWPSARALAAQLVEKWEPLPLTERASLRVLEVGCGLALPSLAIARLGVQVTATDFHPEVPRFLDRNRELNDARSLQFVRLDWQNAPAPLGEFDWIVGSDILYERQHAPQLAQAIARQAGPRTQIVVTDPGRPYLQAFSDEMKRLGFDCQLQGRPVPTDHGTQEIYVLSFNRKAT